MKTASEVGLTALAHRQPGDILFRTVTRDVTLADFLTDVAHAASMLPDRTHLLNCCTQRYWFAVAFAAALVRGQINVITGEQSPLALAKLAARFGSLAAVTDLPGHALPVPHVVIGADADAAVRQVPMPVIPAARVAAIVFTSGSTGEPEGTEKSFGELAARSVAAAARFGFDDDGLATIIGTVPPNHMYGLETTILLPLHARVASWCDPVFYPADLQLALGVLRTAENVLVTSPLQLRAMLEMAGAARYPTMVISATAPLDPVLAAQAEARWGTRVMEIFGATEVGSVASRRTVMDEAWWVYPGVTLAGEDGPMVSADGAQTRRLNDVITLQDGGTRFRLVGRCGDLVKLGGRRASLAGLSRILLDIDGVSDGIFVAPDDLERPHARLAALMVSDVLSAADVLAALRTRIDPLFLPRPLLHVSHLPRNALGKLPLQALRPVLAQSAGMDAAHDMSC